jgi:TolB-like protein
MKAKIVRALLVLPLSALLFAPLARADGPERIWILPFTQLQPDPALEYLQDALPGLLAAAISESSDVHSVVEREKLDLLLSEQALTLERLTSPETRQRIGTLLGATVLITGSFFREGEQLHVTMRASDLENGHVASTADASGDADHPGALISDLYNRLSRGLGRQLPDLARDRIDHAPLSNLHFMKGLGHYYGARYSHSVAEFTIAAEEEQLADISRLWLANAYLAQRQYSHACLELARLTDRTSRNVSARDVAAKMRECERRLGGEDMRLIRDMALRQGGRTAK